VIALPLIAATMAIKTAAKDLPITSRYPDFVLSKTKNIFGDALSPARPPKFIKVDLPPQDFTFSRVILLGFCSLNFFQALKSPNG
jgi:hypothetical protein